MNSTGTLVTFITPNCTAANATAYKRDLAGDLVELPSVPGENGEFAMPALGVAALSFDMESESACNNRYMGAIVSKTFLQGNQPTVPTSSCEVSLLVYKTRVK